MRIESDVEILEISADAVGKKEVAVKLKELKGIKVELNVEIGVEVLEFRLNVDVISTKKVDVRFDEELKSGKVEIKVEVGVATFEFGLNVDVLNT